MNYEIISECTKYVVLYEICFIELLLVLTTCYGLDNLVDMSFPGHLVFKSGTALTHIYVRSL